MYHLEDPLIGIVDSKVKCTDFFFIYCQMNFHLSKNCCNLSNDGIVPVLIVVVLDYIIQLFFLIFFQRGKNLNLSVPFDLHFSSH